MNAPKYTGIGSRKTPQEACELIRAIAGKLAGKGWIVRSGGANGADKAFEEGARGRGEIFLPWPRFNKNNSPLNSPPDKAFDIASSIHPNWKRLTPAAKKFHARNVQQVLGERLDEPSEFLICWTEGGKAIGGSATAINLARQHGISVFNLGLPDVFKEAVTIFG